MKRRVLLGLLTGLTVIAAAVVVVGAGPALAANAASGASRAVHEQSAPGDKESNEAQGTEQEDGKQGQTDQPEADDATAGDMGGVTGGHADPSGQQAEHQHEGDE